MTTNKSITFAEFRRFLKRFGYVEKRIEKPKMKGSVFHRAGKDMLIYRLYDEGARSEGNPHIPGCVGQNGKRRL